jgi:hypothetical protein
MLAIGRAFEENHHATLTGEAQFCALLAPLARQAVRAAFAKRGRRALY